MDGGGESSLTGKSSSDADVAAPCFGLLQTEGTDRGLWRRSLNNARTCGDMTEGEEGALVALDAGSPYLAELDGSVGRT